MILRVREAKIQKRHAVKTLAVLRSPTCGFGGKRHAHTPEQAMAGEEASRGCGWCGNIRSWTDRVRITTGQLTKAMRLEDEARARVQRGDLAKDIAAYLESEGMQQTMARTLVRDLRREEKASSSPADGR